MSDTMRIARAVTPKELAVETVPLPEPGAGEVRVRLEACGICGTDLHFFHGGLWAPGHTPGHEMVGRVDACGEGVAHFSIGERVAIEPIRACGSCAECAAGRPNICRETALFGVHLPGGWAEAICVPAQRLFPTDPELAPAVAALAEPVAVAVHGLRRVDFAAGQRALVLGSGSVGLVSVLAARAAGASEVWATARYEAQAKRAVEMGASRVLTEQEATPQELDRLSRDVEFDVVVETVGGQADTLTAAVSAVRPGGVVSVLGVFFGNVEIPAFPALLKETTLAWSNCYDRRDTTVDFERAVSLVEDERERLAPLTTHQRPLEAVGEALALASDKAAGAVKVTILPGA